MGVKTMSWKAYLLSLKKSSPDDYDFFIDSDTLDRKLRNKRHGKTDGEAGKVSVRMTRATLNLSHHLSSLTTRQLEVYRLYHEQGITQDNIAKSLGLSRSSIRNILSDIRMKALRLINIK